MSDAEDGDRTWQRARARPLLPLFDRLVDEDPDSPADRTPTPAAALAALRASLQHDLEALLNTRRRWRSWDARLGALGRSSVGYGIPDFAGGAFNEPRRREELRAEIEATIRRFEPRLASLRVSLVDRQERLRSTLRLRIEGLLHADPAPEPITFETLIEASTTDVTVLAERG